MLILSPNGMQIKSLILYWPPSASMVYFETYHVKITSIYFSRQDMPPEMPICLVFEMRPSRKRPSDI